MLFEVSEHTIEKLSDADLRNLIGRLCIAELEKHGEGSRGVTFGGNQDASDGGVDVRAQMNGEPQSGSYILSRNTMFQVKKPQMPSAKINAEMKPNGELRSVIAELNQAGGAYVIVSSGDNCTDTKLRNRLKTMNACVSEYENIQVDFYDIKRIVNWTNQHPSVIAWANHVVGEQNITGWQPYSNWSSSIKTEYFVNEEVCFRQVSDEESKLTLSTALVEIRKKLNSPGGGVRLVGLSGIGKTRFLEALFEDGVGEHPLPQSLALYTDAGSNPNPSIAHMAELLVLQGRRCILIIDNCSPEEHRKIHEICSRDNSQISLITVEHDIREDIPRETDVYCMEPASNEVLESILRVRFSHLSHKDIYTIVDFSDGNARIAISLAESCKNGKSIAGLNDKELMDRLILQTDAYDEKLLQAARIFSLVYSFDIDDESNELDTLASIARLQESELYMYCSRLVERGLIQKRSSFRAVLPHALANRLACDALRECRPKSLIKVIVGSKNDRLLRSFAHRLWYLSGSNEACQIANELLNQTEEVGYPEVSDLLHNLIEYLAPLEPRRVLDLIIKGISTGHTALFLKNYSCTDYIRLLYHLSYDATMFKEAAQALVSLAISNHSYRTETAHNALIHLFQACLSGTHATLEQRCAFIKDLLSSNNETVVGLGKTCLDQMLETGTLSGNGYLMLPFGGYRRDYGYEPPDLREWYAHAIRFSFDLIHQHTNISEELKQVLGNNMRNLCAMGVLSEFEQEIDERFNDAFWPEAWYACIRIEEFDADDLPKNVLAQVLMLKDQLAPKNLEQWIKATVLSKSEHRLDLEIELRKRSIEESLQIYSSFLINLGNSLAKDMILYERLLLDLLTAKGSTYGLGLLGCGFGESCDDAIAAWEKVQERITGVPDSNVTYAFVVGFYEGISGRSPKIAERMIDDAVHGMLPLHTVVKMLYVDQGVNCHKKLMWLLSAFPDVTWDLGGFPQNEDYDIESNCCELIQTLFKRKGSLDAVASLAAYESKSLLWKEYNKTVIECIAALDYTEVTISDHTLEHLAFAIRKRYDANNSRDNLVLLCKKLYPVLNSIAGFHYRRLLVGIAEADVKVLLDVLFCEGVKNGMIECTMSSNGVSVIEKGDRTAVCEWIEENPDERLIIIAKLLDMIGTEENKLIVKPLARYIIDHPMVSFDALNELKKRLRPSSWSGEMSLVLERRKEVIRSLCNHENPVVKEWADEVIEHLEQQIEREKNSERSREPASFEP